MLHVPVIVRRHALDLRSPAFFVNTAVLFAVEQDDLAAMGAIRFRFLEKTNPSGAVQNIATSLGEDEVDPAEVSSMPNLYGNHFMCVTVGGEQA